MKKSQNLKAKIKINFKFYGSLILGYSIFFLLIFGIGFLLEKTMESIFLVIGYFATRFCVPKIKHFDTTQKCISVTTMTFAFAIALLCIPKEISLIWSIGIGGCIPIIMYIESLLFDPVVSDKDKLIAICKVHNYNELKTEMAIKFFVEKQKPKDVWLWLCETKKNPVEWDSVKKIKYRMKKDLFK